MSQPPAPFVFDGAGDAKRHAPATLRNRDAIADVLRRFLPGSGVVLEVASGTGEHIVHFAGLFSGLSWQPSDPDPAALASIAAWSQDYGGANLRPALLLDAATPRWPVDRADAILCCNMIHIAPWTACVGLMRGAAACLAPGGRLFLYGPFLEDDVPTAASNLAFDESLRARNAAWGVRHLNDVAAAAARHGLALEHKLAMPANNLMLLFALQAGL